MKKVVVIGAAVGFAAALGYFVQQRLQPVTMADLHPPAPTAEAAPADQSATAEEAPLKVPETMPSFLLADSDGKKRGLKDWAGHPLMVNFWATWCGPCRREIPLLESLRQRHSGEGLEVIGIAVDIREAVLRYALDMHMDYPLLIGEQDGLDAVAAFGME